MKAKITLEIEIPKKVPLDKVDEWAKFEVGFSGALGRDNPLYKERLRDKVYSISVMADEGPTRTSKLTTSNEDSEPKEFTIQDIIREWDSIEKLEDKHKMLEKYECCGRGRHDPSRWAWKRPLIYDDLVRFFPHMYVILKEQK